MASDALGTVPWANARSEFHSRRVTSLYEHLTTTRIQATDLHKLDAAFVSNGGQDHDVDPIVERVFDAADQEPAGTHIVGLYLIILAREKWESSTDWKSIEAVLLTVDRVGRVVADRSGRAHDSVTALVAILDYVHVVIGCMNVENALNCSCPEDFANSSQQVVNRARHTLDAVQHFPSELAGPRELLKEIAYTDLAYYLQLSQIGHITRDAFERQPGAVAALERLVEQVNDAAAHDPHLSADVFGTELEAHSYTLQQMRAIVDAPWLHIGHARVVYCYPFSMPVNPVQLCNTVLQRSWRPALAGRKPGYPRAVRLADTWEDYGTEQSGYSLVGMPLPPLQVRTTDPDPSRKLLDAKAEVRLSRLGNHVVRVELELNDANPHYINQAMRRPTESMGMETIRRKDENTPQWPRLLSFATAVVSDLWAAAESELDLSRSELVPATTRTRPDLPRDVHVVLSLRKLTVVESNGTSRRVTGSAVLDQHVVGSSLLEHPVRQSIATLDEWLRYPHSPEEDEHVLARDAFRGDAVLRTANSTIIAMPTVPDFIVRAFEEGAEFVATLPVLVRDWRAEIADTADRLSSKVDPDRPSSEVNSERVELERLRRSLHKRAAEIKAQLGFLRSPQLCRTADARRFLNQLSEAAGIRALEEDLEQQLERAIATYEQVVDFLGDLSRRHEERTRRFLELVLAAIAATSLADAIALVNDVYQPARWVVWIEACSIGLIAIGIVLLVKLIERRPRYDDAAPSRSSTRTRRQP